jgi:predicted nucleic acid-binding protein
VSLATQNLVEIWAVATRLEGDNGLGFSTERAAAELTRLKAVFTILVETSDLYPAWEALVIKHRVSGKPTHDARLVAAMKVHGLNSILTFNTGDFTRYPGIEVVHPADVLRSL